MGKPGAAERQRIAQNRKARHDYFISDRLEAGLVLTGTEVKALRAGRASIAQAYASEQGGNFVLLGAHIEEYGHGNRFNHNPKRPRRLLLHAREIRRLIGAVQQKGMTLVPLELYFDAHGRAKLELGLAQGKRKVDKRQAEKQRDWQRQKARVMAERG